VGAAFAGTACVYLLRSDLSTAIIPMAKQLGWSKATQGGVLSACPLGRQAK
jgi:sugar phosphate permease